MHVCTHTHTDMHITSQPLLQNGRSMSVRPQQGEILVANRCGRLMLYALRQLEEVLSVFLELGDGSRFFSIVRLQGCGSPNKWA